MALCASWLLTGSASFGASGTSPDTPAIPSAQVDQKTETLLHALEEQIAAERIVSPPNDNAMETWQRVLQLMVATHGSPEFLKALTDFEARTRVRAGNENAAGNKTVAVALTVFADEARRLAGNPRSDPLGTTAPASRVTRGDGPAEVAGAVEQAPGSGTDDGSSGPGTHPAAPPNDVTNDGSATSASSPAPAPGLAANDGSATPASSPVPAPGPATNDGSATPASSPAPTPGLAANDGSATPASSSTPAPGRAANDGSATPASSPTPAPGRAANGGSALPASDRAPVSEVTNQDISIDQTASPPRPSRSALAPHNPEGTDVALSQIQIRPGDSDTSKVSPVEPLPDNTAARPAPKADDPAPNTAVLAIPPATRPLSAPGSAMAAFYATRGDAMLALKDISAARKFYEYAANAGSARAAIALARTFDAAFVARLGVVGLKPDPELAAAWYQKAAALGDPGSGTPLPTQKAATTN